MLRSIRDETTKKPSRQAAVIDRNEIEKMKQRTKIETAEMIKEQAKLSTQMRDTKLADSNARKARMQAMDRERANKVPPTDIEQSNRNKDVGILSKAQSLGMKFIFVSRERYKELTRDEKKAKHLCAQDAIYMIPEGGSNALAVKGVAEMLTEEDLTADYLCCSVGTGATLAGLVEAARPQQQVLGFAALDHHDLAAEVGRFTKKSTYEIVHDYTFGGYAKVSDELISCMNEWLRQTGVLFDPVYTAKMMYGILDRVRRGAIPKGSVILAIHTGGLQGIEGMNSRLEKKNAPLILTSCSKKAS